MIKNPDALAYAINSAFNSVKGKKIATKHVVASLPEEKSFFQVIKMPQMTEKELETSVPFEAENYIPLSIDKAYLDFAAVDSFKSDNSNHVHVLVNAVPKVVVDSYLACLKKAGMVPCVLELESQAAARALMKKEESSQSAALIDFSQSSTNFMIFSKGYIRFTASIPVSSEQLTMAISRELDISRANAEKLKISYGFPKKEEDKYDIAKTIKPILLDLSLRIKKYIDFYNNSSLHEYDSRGDKVEKLILSGGGANLKNLADFFFKELKIKTELGNPMINISQKNRKIKIPQESLLSFTSVIGLALRGATENL
ncbi:MAG: type IV pilus assembly protein PilM, partial [Patescibacteria group bacterium]